MKQCMVIVGLLLLTACQPSSVGTFQLAPVEMVLNESSILYEPHTTIFSMAYDGDTYSFVTNKNIVESFDEEGNLLFQKKLDPVTLGTGYKPENYPKGMYSSMWWTGHSFLLYKLGQQKFVKSDKFFTGFEDIVFPEDMLGGNVFSYNFQQSKSGEIIITSMAAADRELLLYTFDPFSQSFVQKLKVELPFVSHSLRVYLQEKDMFIVCDNTKNNYLLYNGQGELLEQKHVVFDDALLGNERLKTIMQRGMQDGDRTVLTTSVWTEEDVYQVVFKVREPGKEPGYVLYTERGVEKRLERMENCIFLSFINGNLVKVERKGEKIVTSVSSTVSS